MLERLIKRMIPTTSPSYRLREYFGQYDPQTESLPHTKEAKGATAQVPDGSLPKH
jgi:hypothetical protein